MPRRRVDMSQEWPGEASPDHSHLRSTRRLSASASTLTSRRLGGSPEAPQSPSVRRLPQLLECPFPYLPDPFPRDPHQRPDLLERHRLAAFLEAVIEVQNLALARRQVLLEDAVDELAHQLAVRLLLDLAAFLAGKPLAQRRRVLIGAVHRRVERRSEERRVGKECRSRWSPYH